MVGRMGADEEKSFELGWSGIHHVLFMGSFAVVRGETKRVGTTSFNEVRKPVMRAGAGWPMRVERPLKRGAFDTILTEQRRLKGELQ